MARHLEGKQMLIYSREWMAWWKPQGGGYTDKRDQAGVYDYFSAWAATRHCGREKGIEFEVTEAAAPVSKTLFHEEGRQ
jgi:hypothetical protein